MRMRLPDGKTKVLTFSYDDNVVQDIRFLEILNRHGLKCTFNVNSGKYYPEDVTREKFYGRMKRSEAISLFKDSGHEIAIHGLTHPFLEKLDTLEMIREITEDKRQIEMDYGQITRGLAYPFGTYSDAVLEVLKNCKVAYARTVKSTYTFKFPTNWLEWHPTCHHGYEYLMDLAKKFVETPIRFGKVELFYVWGHTYEFDDNNNWEIIEEFAEYMGGHDHIWYATNIEIYDYVKAYTSLETSFDQKMIHNPSAIPVWVEIDGEVYEIKSGETLRR
ncbi:MAG: polysaccharide deacetylase family protein [Clostridia bacterium]|nr:polysaccharide deacetylase family protein [Clostridia bacterium]